MAVNLIRNSRVFFTTNVDPTTGKLVNTSIDACTAADTFEIQVLDGFSYSQNTTTETVTLNEAGDAPVRGQRTFNTALDPVEFSFSTYIRPDKSTDVTAEESVLWDAFAAKQGTTGWTVGDPSVVSFANSNAHQLKKFALIIRVDNDTYLIENCVLNEATIDFGIDAIATIAWSGNGATLVRKTLTLDDSVSGEVTFVAGSDILGKAKAKNVDANFLANKLSTVVLKAGINNAGGTAYTVPITGGNITLSNNITYLTPANLGIVNTPITYFTGTRAVSGSLNAYLRTGTGSTSDLLNVILNDTTTTEPKFNLVINIGGNASATLRVAIEMMGVSIQTPAVNVEQVISTTINFTAQGYTGSAYDLEATNEALIKYYSPA